MPALSQTLPSLPWPSPLWRHTFPGDFSNNICPVLAYSPFQTLKARELLDWLLSVKAIQRHLLRRSKVLIQVTPSLNQKLAKKCSHIGWRKIFKSKHSHKNFTEIFQNQIFLGTTSTSFPSFYSGSVKKLKIPVMSPLQSALKESPGPSSICFHIPQ